MRAQPKTWELSDGPEPIVHYFPNGDVLIEAVIVDPPSSKGRGVNLHVTVDMVPAVLKAFRSAAIAIRSKPMASQSTSEASGG